MRRASSSSSRGPSSGSSITRSPTRLVSAAQMLPSSSNAGGAMSEFFVRGIGAVSPAGWGIAPLREAIRAGAPVAHKALPRPGQEKPLAIRQVPPPPSRPAFLAHARLRRTSPISHHVVAAALEALGDDTAKITDGSLRVGIIVCVMSGCVNYSRRFYDEVLR